MKSDEIGAIARALAAACEEHGTPNSFAPGELYSTHRGLPPPMRIGEHVQHHGSALNEALRPFGYRVVGYDPPKSGAVGAIKVDALPIDTSDIPEWTKDDFARAKLRPPSHLQGNSIADRLESYITAVEMCGVGWPKAAARVMREAVDALRAQEKP